MTPSLRAKYTFGALAGLSLVGSLAGCAATADDASSSDSGSGTSSSASTTAPSSASTGAASTDSTGTGSSTYTDGTYTADGDYQAPGESETITVELTLADDVVTAVTVTPQATSGNGKRYQTDFAEGIAAEVVGKDIDDLDVGKVAGSSLTGNGFNDALETIKADAAA